MRLREPETDPAQTGMSNPLRAFLLWEPSRVERRIDQWTIKLPLVDVEPKRFPPEPIRSPGAMVANRAIRRRATPGSVERASGYADQRESRVSKMTEMRAVVDRCWVRGLLQRPGQHGRTLR